MDKQKINYALVGLMLGALILGVADFVTMKGFVNDPAINEISYGFSNSISMVLKLMPLLLMTYYSVISSQKSVAIIGCITLLLDAGYALIKAWQPYLLIFALIGFLGSAVLFFSLSRNKKVKGLTLCALVLLALYNLLNTLFPLILLLTGHYGVVGVASVISSGFSWLSKVVIALYFVALGIYVLTDGKPFEKRTTHRKEYIHQKNTVATSLADQLNLLKNDYEAGNISADEYKTRRIEVLRSSNK